VNAGALQHLRRTLGAGISTFRGRGRDGGGGDFFRESCIKITPLVRPTPAPHGIYSTSRESAAC
jgi:hypothetical protein